MTQKFSTKASVFQKRVLLMLFCGALNGCPYVLLHITSIIYQLIYFVNWVYWWLYGALVPVLIVFATNGVLRHFGTRERCCY